MGWKYKECGGKQGECFMKLKSLSVFLYLKGNPKKFIPQILVVALGVFLMYFICIIGGGIENQMKDNILSPYEKLSYVNIDPASVNEQKYIDKLKVNKDIDRIIYSDRVRNLRMKMLISDCGSPGFFVSEGDTSYLMKKFGFKLEEGRIPRDSNEILVNSEYAKSRSLKIGSYLDENVDKGITGKYKIVGLYLGKNIIAFGHIKNLQSVKSTVNSIIIVPKNGKLSKVNSYLDSISNRNITVVNYKYLYFDIGGFFPMFNIFAVIVLVITIAVLTFTIGNMNYIHFFDRVSEFSILDAVGYTKLNIFFKLAKEMLIVIVLGFILGIIISFIGGNIFNQVYCEAKGTPVEVYSKWYIVLSLIVPTAVGVFSSIPSLRFLSKMNTIDVLEGRSL